MPPSDEGLRINDTTMSQIPTYVTGIPDGTEKVSLASALRANWSLVC